MKHTKRCHTEVNRSARVTVSETGLDGKNKRQNIPELGRCVGVCVQPDQSVWLVDSATYNAGIGLFNLLTYM